MTKLISFDALRFIACIFIILHHTAINIYQFHHIEHSFFRAGGLAVEIFFIISGFLLAKSAYKALQKGNELPAGVAVKNYFWGRVKRLWPEYMFALLLCALLTNLFSHHLSMRTFMLNVTMMAGWGNIPNIINGIWYVIILFWGGCLLFNLIILYRERATSVILPIISFLCLFYLINHGKNITGHQYPIEFNLISKGTIRGLLGLSVGIYCYQICEYIKTLTVQIKPKALNIFLGICELTVVCLLINTILLRRGQNIDAFNIYFYIAFLVGLLSFKKEFFLRFLSWHGWERVAYLSYTIYLTHIILLEILRVHWVSLNTMNPAVMFVIVTILCVAFGFVCYHTQKWIFNKLKHVFLSSAP